MKDVAKEVYGHLTINFSLCFNQTLEEEET